MIKSWPVYAPVLVELALLTNFLDLSYIKVTNYSAVEFFFLESSFP